MSEVHPGLRWSRSSLLSERRQGEGKSTLLTAIPFDQIVVIYPVAHIGALMRRAKKEAKRLPTFLDLNESEIIALLKTRLW